MRGQVKSGLMLLSTMNFCNNFVSVHQFTTATKVLGLGCIQQSATLVPATSNHFHNHSNVGNFTNNVHVSNAIQHNYCNSTSKILSPNVHIGTKPTTVGSKTLWIDNVTNHDDFMEINVPSQIQGNEQNRIVRTPEQSQTVQRFNEHTQIVQNSSRPILIHHASTMTDFDSEDNYTSKRIHKDSSEDDSSKSSLEDYQFFQKSSCYTVCSNINVKSNAAAMAEYLERLQPSIPLEIEEFLKNYGVNVHPCRWKSKNIKEEDCVRGRPETQLSTNVDGSVLYSCTECKMTFAQKEIIEQHLSVHKLERKYECNVCGLCLKRKEHLDQHKRGHSEARPFVCDICYKGFKRNEHLRRHIVIHSGDKCHLCIQCGKAFSRKDHLNKHLQTHVSKQTKSELSESQSTSPSL